ncbi:MULTISPECIES: glutathione S-transferase family protein [Ramlibacter]|uniref:Glutathione S-transferase n=1 Tax=Ramlibacter pinisoli TaxID=2682844 RepID=A0A6N8IVS3_9BURK|nr:MULTISPECIES: glutathione S-transferase N-terminal domain-containing protein [Ramlibacter]MBA2965131.1 glutathione S-transferase N-terminal domain-containing protein [Ramlibacter sp. CGMCC 1.13660]MVQ30096.1 glutathione S-transferase [Ramlibacter pinisoli]
MIHLYAFDTPNGRKISVALEEMQLPYDVTIVDIGKGEQFAETFLRISPNNKIPAVVDDEGPEGPLSIFESGAILVYLGQKTGKFWPSSIADQAEVLQWLMFQVGGFGPMPGQVHHFVGLTDEQDRRYGLERFQAETRRLYAVMNRHLDKRRWFAKELSIADFAILGWVWRHARHRVDLADFPAVARWYADLMERPGVQRGFAIELRRQPA